MAATKKLLFILIFNITALAFSQIEEESNFPKDTIYVKYEDKQGAEKWNAKFEGEYKGEKGIYYNVKSEAGDMALFYAYHRKADTLDIEKISNYKISDLKEINQKRREWIFDYKRPPANKNGVFQTYLIEVISKDCFVVYPVIWRNEGAKP